MSNRKKKNHDPAQNAMPVQNENPAENPRFRTKALQKSP